MSSLGGLVRCSGAADSKGTTPKPTGEEGPSKNTMTEEVTAASNAASVKEVLEKKKMKMVVKKVPEQFKFVLAAHPTPRSRPSPALLPGDMTEQIRRQSARMDEIINSMNESLRASSRKSFAVSSTPKGTSRLRSRSPMTNPTKQQVFFELRVLLIYHVHRLSGYEIYCSDLTIRFLVIIRICPVSPNLSYLGCIN